MVHGPAAGQATNEISLAGHEEVGLVVDLGFLVSQPGDFRPSGLRRQSRAGSTKDRLLPEALSQRLALTTGPGVDPIQYRRSKRSPMGIEWEDTGTDAAATDAFGIDGYKRLEEVGVTHVMTMPWVFYGASRDSLEEKRDGVFRFAEDIIQKLAQRSVPHV